MPLEQRSKQDFWLQDINDWRQSRLTQKEYCKQNNVSFSNFGNWRTRLNQSSKTGSKLTPVSVGHPSVSVAVYLPRGLRLEVPGHALADALPIVYRTVQAQPK
jgi:hypothetical protein